MSSDERIHFYLSRLEDQRHLLRTAISGIRAGDLTQALTIATAIRVLVHETRRSEPLLKNLRSDYLTLPIHDWIRNPANTAINLPICVKISFSSNEPKISLAADPDKAMRTTSLGDWWTVPFVRIPAIGEMSRRELILGLANKEGAHVDADLSEKYRLLLQSQFFQIKINNCETSILNLSRLLAGSSGAQLLDCLDMAFKSQV
jgi:hypothetical protein